MKAFETESAGGDTLEIKLLNRYSSAASHWGIAREAAAILGRKVQIPDKELINIPEDLGKISIKILEPELCPRYSARYFELQKIGNSPAWMQKALKSCGLRPINAVVDIMNYVMLETGQPLHAFDADKLEQSAKRKAQIIVRRAAKGEKFVTLDGQKFKLDRNILVIADTKEPLAIAGVKGGEKAEVVRGTRRIIVEAASFSGANIYRTSRQLGLVTDASLRFAQGLSPYLVNIGADRATVLLRDILKARLVDSKDVYKKLPGKEIIEFDVDRFNKIIGVELPPALVISYLKRLGFNVQTSLSAQAGKTKSGSKFIVEVPRLRDDITILEDLVEEVARLYGFNNLPSVSPVIGLAAPAIDDTIRLKDEIRSILTAIGFNEVYNYSFCNKRSVLSHFLPLDDARRLEIENPISEERRFLRSELVTGLAGNIENNRRIFDELRIFEIGKVWIPKEELHLGIGIYAASGEPFLDLKGIVQTLLKRVGLTDFMLRSSGKTVFVEADHKVLGFVSAGNGKSVFAEINLDALVGLASAEYEFKPLPKYPAVTRDLSLAVYSNALVGDIMAAINEVKTDYVEDVDLLDYYDQNHFTFRIIFRAADRTLTDAEANSELAKIIKYLRGRFKFEVR
jgi:phenylalanyl-tRNA synthetase beta chain